MYCPQTTTWKAITGLRSSVMLPGQPFSCQVSKAGLSCVSSHFFRAAFNFFLTVVFRRSHPAAPRRAPLPGPPPPRAPAFPFPYFVINLPDDLFYLPLLAGDNTTKLLPALRG